VQICGCCNMARARVGDWLRLGLRIGLGLGIGLRDG